MAPAMAKVYNKHPGHFFFSVLEYDLKNLSPYGPYSLQIMNLIAKVNHRADIDRC